MSVRAVIRRGIYELGCESDLADRIGDARGWKPSTRHRRVRLMQALSDFDSRSYDADWVEMALDLFADLNREDLCDEICGAMQDARWAGRRRRETRETDALPDRPRVHRARLVERKGESKIA